MADGFQSVLRTFECGALCTAAVACASALHADLPGVAFTVLIIHTLGCLTVHTGAVGSSVHGILHTVHIAASLFALLEAVAACLLGISRILAAHLDGIQAAQKLIVVYTCLYRTF